MVIGWVEGREGACRIREPESGEGTWTCQFAPEFRLPCYLVAFSELFSPWSPPNGSLLTLQLLPVDTGAFRMKIVSGLWRGDVNAAKRGLRGCRCPTRLAIDIDLQAKGGMFLGNGYW